TDFAATSFASFKLRPAARSVVEPSMPTTVIWGRSTSPSSPRLSGLARVISDMLGYKVAFDAFISYSSKDKAAADATCAVLEASGVRCWVAPRDIRTGAEYGGAIIEAIDHCRVMILVFSSSANASQQIHREIERAVSKGVPILPVRIEEVTPTKSMAYFLGAIHRMDALC